MKLIVQALLILGCTPAAFIFAKAGEANPVQKVLELLADLQQKVIADGEASQKVYEEFAEECKDRSVQLHHSIKTSKALAEDQKASLEQASDVIVVSTSKIDDLSSAISSDENDLKVATELRTKEAADFAAAEAELTGSIDTLDRAIGIVEKKGASFVQQNGQNLAQALSALIDASSLNTADGERLTALVQNSESSGDDASEYSSLLGAPDAAVYESHSSSVVETLEGLLDKAQDQLDELRKTEVTAKGNYALLKQSLEDKIKSTNKDLDRVKKTKAEAEEKKANVEKALAQTEKDIAEDTGDLEKLHHSCMSTASDYEAETASRAEELKALAEAKKVISEFTGGAETIAYGASASFVQIQQQHKRMSSPGLSAIRVVRQLAWKRNSPILSQLVSRMEATVQVGGKDVFAKVKGLISDMIARLTDEAHAEAAKKAYCDKELAETKAKQEDKGAQIEKLTAQIDEMSSDNVQLLSEISTIQNELNEIAQMQAEMDKLRLEEKTVYAKVKTDMEAGVKGVQVALKVLRDYYSKDEKDHEAGQGAGDSIIGILEVVESDFSKGLSEATADEDAAQAAYEEQTQRNVLAKATKEQDRLYKTKESKQLEKSISDLESDRANAQSELDAVNTYSAKITEECVAKAEPYEERKRRREEEIAGLEEALKMLEAEAPALVQKSSTRRVLRGVRRHT